MLIKSMAAHRRLGRRYGKWAKMPVGEKMEGIEMTGLAKVPPIAGPMIVPIDQTNGITANARAIPCQRRHGKVNIGKAYVHARAS